MDSLRELWDKITCSDRSDRKDDSKKKKSTVITDKKTEIISSRKGTY